MKRAACRIIRTALFERNVALDQIDDMGYGLTLGVHSRIDGVVDQVTRRLSVGNCYINRNMIGAVVGGFFHYMKVGPIEEKEDDKV